MKILETKSLKKYYGKDENLVKAVDDINLSVEEGEFVVIIGTSGSGKSTLLNMLGGLDRPTSGKVLIENNDIFSMDDEKLAIFRRRRIGFVFQAYNLVPILNVWENVILPIGLDGKEVDEVYVRELMETLDIYHKKNSLPNAISGGQQQRTAIARALASKPSIILADEPTGNLDSKTAQEVMSLLKMSVKKYHQTLIMITHDDKIAQMGDRVIRIEDGKVKAGEV
ncbi:ABC-type antimicrobial peptide transport system, ATPase component [Clostridium pasteurianum DSM 525 = ATCC 6013]|uniref:ABC-type antimicrobial peptide transport system, ATPase component n=1 Tax=Clostridium pasteurianum DSM 525 = ATCC 6013 TaxID=1262449 RepID=A0A0H3JBL0_CLOPA|nr:ABC transporter ATP-binding protein [Clostridium pasteurianum]AJA49915.1 ABC-type antimicrobial peptide transport system, ATPase component [Clostridium pasteurianum DSM 525 = ATCC 6013]AJA53903.1 ABC-type antimicrobial peptide transport system, ATPase component [Clostridium pasteurianum DSM 525 = ATCC 6013]AOZ77053.1 ABC transporter ATP-binding protein [Clostridium pasteurianum DSM 525 = ATCC 6013]AOZ80850.1 ABC transporter ATP-binding protein [Clostridium pasteurianum]ELP57873.1 ABC transp